MQKTIIGMLSLTTLALAVVAVVQWRQLQVARERLKTAEETARLESEAREIQSAKATDLERTARRLEQQVGEFTKVTTTLRASEVVQASNVTSLAQQLRAVQQPSEETSGLFGKEMGDLIGKMMKDPSMREMMRTQQKAAINTMYSGLFKELQLMPEEKEKLSSLLVEAQMKTIEQSKGMFGGQEEGANSEDAAKLIAEARKQSDEEIKALLGEERFAQFTSYQKDLGEHMQIDQLSKRLEADNLPLQEAQAARLLQVMKEEKAAVPPIIPTDASQVPRDLKSLMTAENMDKQLQWMDDYNRRVLDRATQFLTPEQAKSYREFQEQQSSLQQMGLKMARGMFGTGKNAPAPPAKP